VDTLDPEQTRVLEKSAILPDSGGAEASLSKLGRYRLLEKLGQGGMGAVYRAEDTASGTAVAIKVLRPELAEQPEALLRFQKEARLLAEVNNPYVIRLLDVDQDAGIHFLALEFVNGKSLGNLLREQGPIEERTAVGIMADVARGLAGAHERGIVHRDIKPDNILLLAEATPTDDAEVTVPSASTPRVKLADFGLARHAIQSESLNITSQGGPIGTPFYMSPEQARGDREIDVRTDVYAMGATLFHLIAGRPPFVADHPAGVIALHSSEPPPPLRQFNARASDGVWQIIQKSLAKAPEERYADATDFLADLVHLLRGEPIGIKTHPLLPDQAGRNVLDYEWIWELEAAPAALWPLVSNTERLNRACGLPAVNYRLTPNPHGGTDALATTRKAGVEMNWDEHPFEWIEGRRFGVLREFKRGFFRWMTSVVELTPRAGGGTRLSHRVRIEPSGVIGRIVAAIEVGHKGRIAVDRVYRRIDAAVTGKLGNQKWADPFELPGGLSRAGRQKLQTLLDELGKCAVDAKIVEGLGDFLAEAPAQEVARIRPLDLARRMHCDANALIAALLHAARLGMLVMAWDLLCPRCRISCKIEDTVRALREHGRCAVCNLDFDLDFANSVEMIFRVSPDIRQAETGTYCLGGPAHSPHVVVQVRVAPGERFDLAMALPEGSFRVRGPQLPYAVDFSIRSDSQERKWNLDLARSPDPNEDFVLKSGGQLVVLRNSGDHEIVVRVERTVVREAFTAARAMAMPLFRELFPAEILAPGQLLSVANVNLLAVEIAGLDTAYEMLGDAAAVAMIHGQIQRITDVAHRTGGTVAKTSNRGVLLLFDASVAAVVAALDLAKGDANSAFRLAIHRGPTFIATVQDHLDYFGQTVHQVLNLSAMAEPASVVLTRAIVADPMVAELLASRGLVAEAITDAPLGAAIIRP
jgi:eukaryotic-like serine/threonine-protein kinase